MIHLLEITPEHSPEKVAKQARKFAMTGGYEVALKTDLKDSDYFKIFEIWSSELRNLQSKSSEMLSSNAWRILDLLGKSAFVPQKLKQQVETFMGVIK
ncbi:MAG: hypothetical protein SGJ02_13370 [bacterium]|nr:hypothetical protein [bacterium]